MKMSVLSMNKVSYQYKEARQSVLSQIDQEFEAGKFYAIIGKSGSGKSTLLSLLAALDNPTSGKILFEGEDIQEKGDSYHRKHHISLVFQNYNLIDYLTPLENIRLVNPQATKEILLQLGLEESHVNRNVLKLSGGQQQRVAIARSLVSEAPIILADEPTGNLDEQTAGEIIDVLKALAKERQKCVIVVTHSKEVANAADTILELRETKLHEVK
jgi:ABC transporter ATP-binding protein vexp2